VRVRVDEQVEGIAKKLMLAAKLKAGMQEATERREQKEMFGDDFDDDPLRKKMAQNDDVNDMLEELGGPSTRANPMADRVSAFAANQEGTGKRVAGTDLAATVSIKQQQKAEEDQVPVRVFRVEYSTTQKRMTLVKQDESEFGSFFDGDSYVILSTKPTSKNAKTMQRELFIWVGQVSTPDEIKGAVVEAATLDCTFSTSFHKDVKTGGLKITRMLQNSETTSFTGLFPGNTVKVIEGGIDEEGGKQGRLYHVHGEGARKMSLTLVPPVLESLDQGDVFVFDCGYDVYIFQGDECSPFEREHGRQYAEKLRQSRAQCIVSVVTQETAQEKFWKALGTTRKIGQAATLRRLESFLPSQINRLWNVRGPKDFKMEASGDDVCMLSLKSTQLMIVDLCSVVYVWVGKSCSPYQELRDTALQRGVEYLEKHSDRKIPLIRVLENFEGDTFKDLVPEEPIDL
jgi:gelsolin